MSKELIGRIMNERLDFIAELHTDGQWTCDNALYQDYLNTVYGKEQYTPADGQFGFKLIADAAKELHAEAEYIQEPILGSADEIY